MSNYHNELRMRAASVWRFNERSLSGTFIKGHPIIAKSGQGRFTMSEVKAGDMIEVDTAIGPIACRVFKSSFGRLCFPYPKSDGLDEVRLLNKHIDDVVKVQRFRSPAKSKTVWASLAVLVIPIIGTVIENPDQYGDLIGGVFGTQAGVMWMQLLPVLVIVFERFKKLIKYEA